MKKTGYFSLYVLIAILLGTLSAGLYFYDQILRDNLAVQTCSTLDEIMEQQKFNFDSKLNSDKEMVRGFARLVSKIPDSDDVIIYVLKELLPDTQFERLAYATPDGRAHNTAGDVWNIGDRDYFQRALQGETLVSEPLKSRVRNATVISVVTPVERGGKIAGVLIGSYESRSLDNLFLSSFNGDGYAYITDNDGEVISKTINKYSFLGDGTNIFDVWKNVNFYMNDNLDMIRKNVLENKGGHARFSYKGQNRLLHYGVIGTNSWNLFSVIPEQSISVASNRILRASAVLMMIIAAVFIALVVYNYMSQMSYIKRLTRLAYFDKLTGAPNYNKFRATVLELLTKYPEHTYVMAKFDIASFKMINELYGRKTGDTIIRIVASCIDDAIDHATDFYCRLNADEFIVFVSISKNASEDAKRKKFDRTIQEKVAAVIPEKLKMPEGRYRLSEGELDFNEIFENVNFAHKIAKEKGNVIYKYDNKLKELALKQKEIENRMENALLHEEFVVYLQPKYRLSDEKIGGAEALVRWKPASGDMVYPNVFIPVFEQNGFITKLDMYIFENVCRFLRDLMDKKSYLPVISSNFSRLHLKDKDFVENLCALADKYGVPRSKLEIEITESVMLDNEEILIKILDKLHDEGFSLSMDDFGTGYSSLGLLKNIPIDVIKIDRSFFVESGNKSRTRSVLLNVIKMAKDLNIHTVAEGVEEREHIDMLREVGCDMVQGYYYAKPMPADEFEKKILEE